MSKRIDIIDGKEAARVPYGLVYAEVLGWIDLGHAQGTDIRNLLRDINVSELSGKDYYNITYSQSMIDRRRTIRMGKFITWRIKRGRSPSERNRIALAMMMSLAQKFEGLQSSFPLSLVTDSGFSSEDLISDLLGFYRVISVQNPFEMLHPVSKEEALKRWDHYGKIGSWKNKTFRPMLFPDPNKSVSARPYKGELPGFMKLVRPWNDFRLGIVNVVSADGSFIDKAKGGALPYASTY